MKKVLVIVDMQNDFIDGVLGSKAAQDIIPDCVHFINTNNFDKYIFTQDTHINNEDMQQELKIKLIKLSLYKNSQEGNHLPIHCIYNTKGWNINNTILSAVTNKVCLPDISFVYKDTFGSLYSERNIADKTLIGRLDSINNDDYIHDKKMASENSCLSFDECNEHLTKENGSRLDITFMGVCTGICVISNVAITRASFPAATISIPEKCTACISEQSKMSALATMKNLYVNVI